MLPTFISKGGYRYKKLAGRNGDGDEGKPPEVLYMEQRHTPLSCIYPSSTALSHVLDTCHDAGALYVCNGDFAAVDMFVGGFESLFQSTVAPPSHNTIHLNPIRAICQKARSMNKNKVRLYFVVPSAMFAAWKYEQKSFKVYDEEKKNSRIMSLDELDDAARSDLVDLEQYVVEYAVSG